MDPGNERQIVVRLGKMEDSLSRIAKELRELVDLMKRNAMRELKEDALKSVREKESIYDSAIKALEEYSKDNTKED